MFVSNHPSLDVPNRDSSTGVAGCQQFLCFGGESYATLLRLFYHTDVVAGGRDGWWETMRRTFAQRDFYACAGVSDLVSVATEPGGAAAAKGAVGQTR